MNTAYVVRVLCEPKCEKICLRYSTIIGDIDGPLRLFSMIGVIQLPLWKAQDLWKPHPDKEGSEMTAQAVLTCRWPNMLKQIFSRSRVIYARDNDASLKRGVELFKPRDAHFCTFNQSYISRVDQEISIFFICISVYSGNLS